MTLTFDRPVGSCCDVNELEYISALHQTDSDIRRDGSIKAIDIVSFLSSRYGITISEEEVKRTILLGLGGGDDDEDCIDMVETVAILLIPYFLKESKMKRAGTSFDDQGDALNKDEGHENVVKRVLHMILDDATESTSPPTLNKDLLVKILKFYGEHEIIENDELLEDMIAAARGTEDRESTVLDLASFFRALTSDVEKYETTYETSYTSNYYDVFQVEMMSHKASIRSVTEANGLEMNAISHDDSSDTFETDKRDTLSAKGAATFDKKGTFSAIDYSSDTFGSAMYVSLLWACAISAYFTYIYRNSEMDWASLGCLDDQYGCKLGQSLILWVLTFLELSILGTLFVAFCSLGTSAYGGSVIMLLLGMATVILSTIVSCFVEVKTFLFDTNTYDSELLQTLQYITLILGCALILLQIMFLLKVLIPGIIEKRCRFIIKHVIDNIKRETYIKRAASLKIRKMVNNAINMCMLEDHASANAKNYQSRALLNFMKYDLETEKVGGYSWTYKRLISGKLYKIDGVWISGRVYAGVASLFCAIFFILATFIDLSRVIYEKDTGVSFVGMMMDFANIITISDDEYNDYSAEVDEALGTVLDPTYNDELVVSVSLGGCFAVALAAFSATIYIPSAATTILQLRSGVIPSLHSDEFIQCRKAVDNVAYIIGFMFWGVMYSSFIFGIIWSGLLYFFISPETRQSAMNLLIVLVALGITLVIKELASMLLRKKVMAFYRHTPKLSNFAGLIFDCWSFGTSIGFMLARVGKLVVSIIFFIGRVDTPILAPGITIFGIQLDTAPRTYMKDILAHEAHRHPYIERLGVMYLMKLRHGQDFAKTSGTIWRMLFVFALMPWLRQYRVETRPEKIEEIDTADATATVKEQVTAITEKATKQVRSIFQSKTK